MSDQRGQSTVEWLGLVLLVGSALALVGAVAGLGLPGAALARTVGARIVCAIELDACGVEPSPLVSAYGDELAALVAERSPQVRYEPGMRALPVDYRECREDPCAEGPDKIWVSRSSTGHPATAFTHVIDCRARSTPPPRVDCSDTADGNLYIQYWLYYPGSATGEGSTPLRGAIREISAAVGSPSFHRDDWESLQFRIRPEGGVEARASAHHGYGGGWAPVSRARYTVAGGSHAGTVEPAEFGRITPAGRLVLIPLEPIAAANPDTAFAVTPPWDKRVWLEPEYEGTD